MFDIYTIIFLALAVFIFLRLRSVLGQRTGRERPPYDPYAARERTRPTGNDKVVALPSRGSAEPAAKPAEDAKPADRWKGIAQPDSAVAKGLDAITAEDKAFEPKHFLGGARAAYEMIVTAYAEGDRRTKICWPATSRRGFDAVIGARETAAKRRDAISDRFHRHHRRRTAWQDCTGDYPLRSQLVSVTRDKNAS